MVDAHDSRPVEILLVEDNAGDIRLTEEALREGKVRNNLHVVMDGVAAMTFVRGIGEYAEAPRPDLIHTMCQWWRGSAALRAAVEVPPRSLWRSRARGD